VKYEVDIILYYCVLTIIHWSSHT